MHDEPFIVVIAHPVSPNIAASNPMQTAFHRSRDLLSFYFGFHFRKHIQSSQSINVSPILKSGD
jgi:hypothetical protein